jgi:hypothetical protein
MGWPALAESDNTPANWITIRAGKVFTFRSPAGTVQYTDGGRAIDSFVQMYRSPQFRLIFDYGHYSNDLSGYAAKRGYVTEKTEIDGRKAIIVTGPGLSVWDCEGYMSAVYLVASHTWWNGNPVSLSMTGCASTHEGIEILHALFHSLRFSGD